MTFEEGFIELMMDPDRLRSARVKSEEEVDTTERRHDVDRGPYVPHHHRAVYEGSRH